MEKRFIRVPKPVTVKAIDGSPTVGPDGKPIVMDFATFIKGRCADQTFGAGGMKTIVASAQIVASLEGITEGMIWSIDLDNYEYLLKSVETPGEPYNPRFAWSIIPHMNAVKDASREEPQNLG